MNKLLCLKHAAAALLCALMVGLALPGGVVSAETEGFAGISVYTATGYQYGTVKLSDVRISNTNIAVPANNYYSTGTPWLTGINYTYVFNNRFTVGAQVEYFPVSTQVSVSITPGYQFNDRIQGYVKLGWVHAPSTVDQGPGRQPYGVVLNGIVAGVGAKALVTRNVYGFIELNYVGLEKLKFNSWAGQVPISGYADTQAINVLVGVGYRF